MEETVRLTYRELGARLGISPDAARMKAKRETKKLDATWRMIPGNHPSDPVYVELPVAELPERPPERSAPTTPDGVDAVLDQIAAVPQEKTDDVLARFAITLHGELTEANKRGDQLADKLLEETTAHGATRIALATEEARHQATAAELEQAITYIGKADREIARLNRSWWERLFG